MSMNRRGSATSQPDWFGDAASSHSSRTPEEAGADRLSAPRHSPTLLVAPALLLLVQFGTALTLAVAPGAITGTDGSDIRDPSLTLIEPGDKAVLAMWYVITIAAAFLLVRVRSLPPALAGRSFRGYFAIAIGIVFVAATWSLDPTREWAGISFLSLLLGTGMAVGLMEALVRPDSHWRNAARAAGVAIGLLAVGSWLQTPSTLVDPYHFSFTADELSSVAAGQFPLHDYAPQYTVLLPFLFAPAIATAPSATPGIVVAGLLLLQLTTVGLAVAFPALIAGRKYLLPALIVIVPPLFSLSDGRTPLSYFQSTPLRVVLPLVTLCVAFVLFTRHRNRLSSTVPGCVLLGLLAGATAFNNLDFGLPALVAVMIVASIIAPGWLDGLRRIALLLAGALIAPAAYAAAAALLGIRLDWSLLLVFPRVFGVAGFMNVAMQPVGLQIAMVALFAAGSIVGFVLLRTTKASGQQRRFRQGIGLALVSGWSMLSLPYLSGRSLPPTYVGSYSLQAGLVLACFLPLTAVTWRASSKAAPSTPLFSARALVAVGYGTAIACVFFLSSPSVRLEQIAISGDPGAFAQLETESKAVFSAQAVDNGDSLGSVIAAGGVVQVLRNSSLFALRHHVPSVAISNSPENIWTARTFARLQCVRPLPDGTRYLLADEKTAGYLSQEPACASYVAWSRERLFTADVDGTDSVFVLVPLNP